MWPILVLLIVMQQEASRPEDVLKQASAEALQGHHQKVVELLYPMLYPTSRLATRDQEIEAHRLLGTAYWFLGRKVEAAQEFTAILNLNPDFQLDPLVVPPGLITFFERVRRSLAARLEEIRKRKKAEEEARRKAEEEERRRKMAELMKKAPVVKEIVTVRRSIFVFNFFPFGVGQFQNGDAAKGWLLAAGQLLAGSLSLGMWWYLHYRYPSGTVPHEEVSLARTLQYVQVGSGAVFWGLWALGVGDALWHYRPTTTSVQRRLVPSVTVAPARGGAVGALTWQW